MLQSLVQSLCICGCIYNPIVGCSSCAGLVCNARRCKLREDDVKMSKRVGV